MDSREVQWLIRTRSEEKRERERSRALRSDATRSWVPFTEYLHYRGAEDWKKLGKYQLTSYYLDYELECLRCGMEYEHPKLYGVTVSLMK